MLNYNIKENDFLVAWMEAMSTRLKLVYPQLTDSQIEDLLMEDINNNFYDPETVLHNDYVDGTVDKDTGVDPGRMIRGPLTKVFKFAKLKKPILAGNGTLFYNQDRAYSPVLDVIDDRINTRATYKKKMKNTMKEMESLEKGSREWLAKQEQYLYQDMMQGEAKIRVNSIYGAFGTSTFFMYNKYTAEATTGTAQSLISTTGISFEAFLGDNVKFRALNECISLIINTMNDPYKMPSLDLPYEVDPDMVIERLENSFMDGVYKDSFHHIISEMVTNIADPEIWKRIYLKNNIYEVLKSKTIIDLYIKVFNKVETFRDPNAVPENIEAELDTLWKYFKEYVFYNHASTERINRLKNDRRVVTKLIDTDSNLVYTQPWVNYMKEHIVPLTNCTLEKMDLEFVCINSLTYFITNMLKDLLKRYCDSANILDRYSPRINMKNEICFKRLLLADAKKRYVGEYILREGRLYNKVEVKGYDFKKAGVTEFIRNAMEGIISERILKPEVVDIQGILKDLAALEADIEESISKGEKKYTMRFNSKPEAAYKNPWSTPQFTAAIAWNLINEEVQINPPDKIDAISVIIPDEAALDKIKHTHPVEYEKMRQAYFHNPMTVKFTTDGVKYFGIPNNVEKIPDYIIPFVDINHIKSRNLNTFSPILEALGLPNVGGSEHTLFSNVRKARMIEI